MMSTIRLLAILGATFLFVACLLPASSLAAGMHGIDPGLVRAGVLLLRVALSLCATGLLAATVLRWRGTEEEPGLPAALLGLQERPAGSLASHPRAAAALALLTLLAAALRVVGLDRDLWLDEIATVIHYLRSSPLEILSIYRSANQHLLYSLLGSASFSIFGESAWSARLPAVIVGVGAIPGLFFLARRVAPEREATWVALLLSVSYHHIWFSQSARGYSGMIFFTVWGTVIFLEALERNRRSLWVLYGLSAVLGVLMLQNTVFVFAGHFTALLLLLPSLAADPSGRRAARAGLRRLAGVLSWAALLTLTFYALQLPQIVHFVRTVDRAGLGSASAGQFLPVLADGLRAGLGAAGALLLLLLAAAGWLDYRRRCPLIAALVVLPPAFNLAVLVITRYGAYPRSFLYELPFVLLLVVRGAGWLGDWARRHGGAALPVEPLVLGALALVSMAALVPLYRYPKQDYTGALSFVDERRAPGDRVGAVGLAAVAYREYYAPGLAFPADPGQLAALRHGHAVWVLYSFPHDMRLRFPTLTDYLAESFQLVARFHGTLGDGDLYVARADRID